VADASSVGAPVARENNAYELMCNDALLVLDALTSRSVSIQDPTALGSSVNRGSAFYFRTESRAA